MVMPCRFPGESDPGQPFRADDAEHVRVVAEAGYLALLDGQQAELARLADRVLDRRAAHARDRGHVLDRQPAVLPARSLGSHQGQHSLLGQREPGGDGRREASRGGPTAAALH